MLAGFAWVIEARGYRKWAFPLVVIGMNSMAAYLIAHLLEISWLLRFEFTWGPMHSRLQDRPWSRWSRAWHSVAYWMVLFWMYRRKIFLRV